MGYGHILQASNNTFAQSADYCASLGERRSCRSRVMWRIDPRDPRRNAFTFLSSFPGPKRRAAAGTANGSERALRTATGSDGRSLSWGGEKARIWLVARAWSRSRDNLKREKSFLDQHTGSIYQKALLKRCCESNDNKCIFNVNICLIWKWTPSINRLNQHFFLLHLFDSYGRGESPSTAFFLWIR